MSTVLKYVALLSTYTMAFAQSGNVFPHGDDDSPLSTLTVTPTNSALNPSMSGSSTMSADSSSSVDKKTLVGAVVGGVVGFIVIMGLLLFFIWREKQKDKKLFSNKSLDLSGGEDRRSEEMAYAHDPSTVPEPYTTVSALPISRRSGEGAGLLRADTKVRPTSDEYVRSPTTSPTIADSSPGHSPDLSTEERLRSMEDEILSLKDQLHRGQTLHVNNASPVESGVPPPDYGSLGSGQHEPEDERDAH